MSSQNRGQWGSKFGFIMAAAGSAVGLGNVWRFPYLTGENGGAAFVMIYVLCVVLVGAPMLINEIAIGRLAAKSPVAAIKGFGANKLWVALVGVLPLIVTFVVLSYYSVIAGWTVGYIYNSLFAVDITFEAFISTAAYVIPLGAFVILMTAWIVLGGVSGGIEKATKIMMPALFVILIIIIIRSVTLPGAMKGVEYYLIPDFSKITGPVVLDALTQVFFSLGIGWGMMITYGSYLPKNQNIVSSSLWVGAMDTSVALLAGFMVFPAVFAFGGSPSQGPKLVFTVLADIFKVMPFGHIAGALFFVLLFFAAITSTISMLEAPSAYFIDNRGWNRKKAATWVAIAAFLIGIPSALSAGAVDSLTHMTVNIFGTQVTGFSDILDHLFGKLFMMLVVLATSLFTGWAFNINLLVDEIAQGAPGFKNARILGVSPAQIWVFAVKYVSPIIIGLVTLNVLGLLG
ncbi:MAG TPA: sodium-dependent transporter [Cyclobacteriaceae bacterium]|nr:sodium-dependent transporter [Cyclobacteriaceae bacterium]